jgi:rubredoxin
MPGGSGFGRRGGVARGGAGGGRGMGQGGGGQGKKGGTGAGIGGNCVCPECGHTEPHRRGNPCNQIECPECGATMTRQI